MCGPAAALGGQAFGVGMSTVGAYADAKAQQASLRSQARVAEINATIADAAARNELAASNRQQSQIRLKGAQIKSSQKAGYAGAGIDVGVGTPVDVATSTDYVTEVDANTARANGIQAAWGQRINAGNLRRGATSARATADGISPLINAGTTLITGATQVASSWYGLNKTGALPKAPSGGSGGGGLTDAWAHSAFGYGG